MRTSIKLTDTGEDRNTDMGEQWVHWNEHMKMFQLNMKEIEKHSSNCIDMILAVHYDVAINQ